MKLAILNSFNFHYEIFGYIIDYCIQKNIRLDIYTVSDNDLGWLSFYIVHYIPGNDLNYDFKNQEGKLIQFYPINGYIINNDYDKVIITTDDDINIPDEIMNDKFICIDHHMTNRRPNIKTHIGLRNFKNRPELDWVLPVYQLMDAEQKKTISKQIVTCIGRFNCPKDISYFKSLFKNFDNCVFAFVDRNLDNYMELYKECKNINCFSALNTVAMINLLIQSDYVFISEENEDHNYASLSGIIPLAFNCLCQIIMPKEMADNFNFKTIISYEKNEQIELIKPNYELIQQELEELIIHKFKIFDKYLTPFFNEDDITKQLNEFIETEQKTIASLSKLLSSPDISKISPLLDLSKLPPLPESDDEDEYYEDDSKNNFEISSIVYKKSEKRVNNFNLIKEQIKELKMFEAIDTLKDNYDIHKNKCIDDNLFTQEYLSYCDTLKGKLGCSLSHINLWKQFLNNSKKDWLLVLEDDVKINNYNPIFIELLIGNANNLKSNHVQLWTNPKFLKEQMDEEKVNYNLYKTTPQWGCLAYLINKKGIEIMLSKLPFYDNNDIMISKNLEELNSLCFINDIFINQGAMDGNDKTSEFGSLLWNS
jgi:GR25 family glycosyltransferase involved in LPS biosynthesis